MTTENLDDVVENDILEDESLDNSSEVEVTPEEQELNDIIANGIDDAAEVETKPEAKPSDKPAEEKKPAQKLEDKDLEPLEGASRAANERIRKLADGVKERENILAETNAKFEQLQNQYKEVNTSFEALQQLGYNDESAVEDLINFSAYRNTLKNADAEGFTKIISEQIQQFELATGKKLNLNVSGLDRYQDLSSKVSNLELNEQDALQLARFRQIEERTARQASAEQQRYQQEVEAQREIDTAFNSVKQFHSIVSSTDPDFAQVMEVVKPQIPQIEKALPPSAWAKAIEIAYTTAKNGLVKAIGNRQAPPVLRGKTSSSSKPVFKNANDELEYLISDEAWG